MVQVVQAVQAVQAAQAVLVQSLGATVLGVLTWQVVALLLATDSPACDLCPS